MFDIIHLSNVPKVRKIQITNVYSFTQGGLFESKHSDSNDVQTISHKVMVLPLEDYNRILQASQRHQKGYEDNDPYYYYAGFYTHPTVTYAPGVTAVLQE